MYSTGYTVDGTWWRSMRVKAVAPALIREFQTQVSPVSGTVLEEYQHGRTVGAGRPNGCAGGPASTNQETGSGVRGWTEGYTYTVSARLCFIPTTCILRMRLRSPYRK